MIPRNARDACRRLCGAALGLGAAVLFMTPASGQLVPAESVVVDGLVAVPILFQGTAEGAVASMQFDVRYDTQSLTLVAVEPGAAASSAGKAPLYSDLESGLVRVVVAGLNRNTIAAGTVAYVYFMPHGNAGASTPTPDWRIVDAIYSNPDGEAVHAPSPDEDPALETPGHDGHPDTPTAPNDPDRPETAPEHRDVDYTGVAAAPSPAGARSWSPSHADDAYRSRMTARNDEFRPSPAAPGERFETAHVYNDRRGSSPGSGAATRSGIDREMSAHSSITSSNEIGGDRARLATYAYQFRDSALVEAALSPETSHREFHRPRAADVESPIAVDVHAAPYGTHTLVWAARNSPLTLISAGAAFAALAGVLLLAHRRAMPS